MAEAVSSAGSTTSTHIELVFDGDAVREGTIEARVLGAALSAYSEAFTRANFLVNGRNSEADVLVDAKFESGSFDVPLLLVQSYQQAQGIIGELKNALELAVILGFVHNPGSLIELLKFLKGEPPERVTPVENGVQYERSGEKKTVPKLTDTLYYDPSVRKALANGAKALEHPGIASISFQREGNETVVINKDEAAAFKADDFELEAETPHKGERDAVLTISKLSFKEGTKWSFFEDGASLAARIDDEEFFRKVHDRKLKFADGDRLSVHLKWQLQERNGRLVADNVITKVHKVLSKKPQLRLDGGTDNVM